MNTLRDIHPLVDHVLCVKLSREEAERYLFARAETARDVNQTASDRRIVTVGSEPIAFVLVLKTGRGRRFESGVLVEPEVKAGDLVLYREAEPRLDLPYRAKELVAGLALDERLHNNQTCMMLEALMLGVVS